MNQLSGVATPDNLILRLDAGRIESFYLKAAIKTSEAGKESHPKNSGHEECSGKLGKSSPPIISVDQVYLSTSLMIASANFLVVAVPPRSRVTQSPRHRTFSKAT